VAFEKGLIILGCGETSIRICPPLIMSEDEAMVGLDILENALTQVETEFAGTRELAGASA
jgi:4-aminobutyrate aminotransferase